MKNLNNFKVAVISLLLFLSSQTFASTFVLNDGGLIDPRTITKVEEIGSETKAKLGANIYVYVKQSLGLPENTLTKDKIKDNS